MAVMTVLIVFIAIIFCCFHFFKDNRRNVNDFPSPPGWFLLGHVPDFRSAKTILTNCSKYLKQYGSVVKLNAGPYFTFLLSNDHKFASFILGEKKGVVNPEIYHFTKPWSGDGLIIVEGIEWKHTRNMLTPAFHSDILKNYVEVFESVGDVLIEKLQQCNDSKSVDMFPLTGLCALDMMCETTMGTKINAQNGQNLTYVNSVDEMGRIIIDRCLSVFKLKNWSFMLTRDYYLQRKVVKVLHDFSMGIIEKKRATEESNEGVTIQKKKLSFLDLLLNCRGVHGEKLSDAEIRQEVDTFMGAGYDNLTAALSFTFFCIANHPAVQEEILAEQKKLFSDEKDPQVTYQDLQDMKYLENVINESLRLYPPIPFVGKCTTEELQYGKHIIGKNTNIALFVYGLHRNPEYFPDPEKFDPERFDRADGSLPPGFAPFSIGQRSCIGQKFALLGLKSVVAKVVRHFELRPAFPKHELDLAMRIVLKSLNGVRIGLKQRV